MGDWLFPNADSMRDSAIALTNAVTDTVIVGAGPAGLAMGACLKKIGVPFVMLEKEHKVGSAWRNHYERLHLHTVKKHSNLPYMEFPKKVKKYPSRTDVVEYLEAYAQHFDLKPEFCEEVRRIRRVNRQWETISTTHRYLSHRVIVATGYNRRPHSPRWPGQETFRGDVVHSSAYRSGSAYAGKRVLVVGIGNTGGEIAIDLHEHGAAFIAICVRSPINIIPRDLLGVPAQVSSIQLSRLPRRIRYALSQRIAHWAIGDLSAYGITWPEKSPMEHVESDGRVPLIDVGTVRLIRNGALRVVPGIESFTRDGVRFTSGIELAFDCVILATGYRPSIHEFLEEAEAVMDARGYPTPPAGESALAGLYFLGYDNAPTGLLRQIALDAQRIAEQIAVRAGIRGNAASN